MTDPEKPKIFAIGEHGTQLPEITEVMADASDNLDRWIIEQRELVRKKYYSDFDVTPQPGLQEMDFGTGGKIYFKTFIRSEQTKHGPKESHEVFCVDVNEDNQPMGFAYAVKREAPGYYRGPLVDMSWTEPGYGRQGLGLRRLVALNQICHMLYSQDLESGRFLDMRDDASEIR